MVTGVLTTSFPRYPGDFAGCFVEDAVRAAATAGETLEVLAAGDGCGGGERAEPPPYTEDRADLLAAGIRVIRLAAPPGLFYTEGAPEALERGGAGVWSGALLFAARLAAAARARATSWNRIVAHWIVPSALAATWAAPGLPLVAHAHSGDIALLERLPWGGALGRRVARRASELLFASADLRRRFGRLTGLGDVDLGPVLPAGGEPRAVPRFQEGRVHGRAAARRELALHDGCRIVLAVGRLVPIKGYDRLLLASARAGAAGAAITVIILGDGPERPRLERLARALPVDLRLPGFVPRAEVARWMAAADLYVQPSRRLANGRTEGTPVAALEAIRAGLPVVAAATGGLVELPGVRLVPADDLDALAAALAAAAPAMPPRTGSVTAA